MKIIGLVPQGQGTNKVFGGCCPAKLRLLVELQPGEPTHNIHRVLWNDPSCGSTIVSVGNNPYADPLSTNFSLTTGVQMEVEIDICPCQGIGTIDTYHLQIITQSPNTTHDFYFDFEGIDKNAYDFIDKTSAYFFDCLNDCGRVQTLFTITNPSPIELPVQLIDGGACGFAFWINLNDGNGFVQTTSLAFNILGNSPAEVAISNPNCLVTSECDFTLDVDLCTGGVTESIPITHEQVDCGDCSIHCDSIEITSVASNVQILQNSNQIDPALWTVGYISPDILFYLFPLPPVPYGDFRVINTLPIGDNVDILTIADWASVIPGYPSTLPSNVEVKHTIKFRNITTPFNLFVYSQQSQSPNSFVLGPSNAYSTFTFTETIPSLNNDPFYKVILQFPAGTVAGNYVGISSIEMEYTANVPVLTPTNLDCSNLDEYNETAIGDEKFIIFNFFYEKGFKYGTQLYFNPFMFSANACDETPLQGPVNSIPLAAWQGTVRSVPGTIPALLYNNGANQIINNIKNYQVYFEIINEYEFQVQFQTFMLQDINNWLGYANPNNVDALLKNDINNPNQLDNQAGNSVYNLIKKFCAYIKIIDPNIVVGQFANGNSVYYECSTVKSVYFNARFWNLGLNNNPSEMQNPTWLLERNSNPVNDISIINPTDVTFTLDYANPIDNAVVYVFDASNNNNNIQFLPNYATAPSWIRYTEPNPGTGFGGVVQSPTQTFTNIGGNTYELKFRISNILNPNGDYYIGVLASSSTDNMINSFLKKVDLKVTPDVGDLCCQPSFATAFTAYSHNNPNQLYSVQGFTPTMDERIGLFTSAEPLSFQTCLENYGFDPLTDNWLNYLKKVTMRIYKRTTDNVAFLGNTYTYYMLREFTATRSQFGTYTLSDPNYFTAVESGINLTTNCYQRVASYDGVFDASKVYTSTLAEPFNRQQWNPVAAAALIANNNMTWSWADQDIYFEQEYSFDFFGIFPVSVPFNMYNVVVAHPIDYETNPQPFTQLMNPLEVYGVNNAGSTLLSTPVICNNSYDHLLVKVSFVNPADTGYLIAVFNDANGNQFTLKEYESFVYNKLPQKTESPLYDVDVAFVGGEAFFKIDLQGLPAGTYKFCGIKSKL